MKKIISILILVLLSGKLCAQNSWDQVIQLVENNQSSHKFSFNISISPQKKFKITMTDQTDFTIVYHVDLTNNHSFKFSNEQVDGKSYFLTTIYEGSTEILRLLSFTRETSIMIIKNNGNDAYPFLAAEGGKKASSTDVKRIFKKAVNMGIIKEITDSPSRVCPACGGRGRITNICFSCRGTGRVR